jgi:hypothetical protein
VPDHTLDPLGSSSGTHREQVERLKNTIDHSGGMWNAGDLKYAVHSALQLDPPKGDPAMVDTLAAACRTASGQVDQVQQSVLQVAFQGLPDAWTGQAGEKATAVVGAAADDLALCRDVLASGHDQLSMLTGALRDAQAQHGLGTGPLQEALKLLHGITISSMPDPVNWDDGKMRTAHAKAQDGIASMFDAAVKAEEAGHSAARELNALADEALAGRFKNKGLGAADKLVLVDASVNSDPRDGSILTANDATRAGQFMDKMTDADRTRFDQLLADTKSPEERAYLMKALAAGHSYDEIKAFDALIRDHADSPGWLAARLSPVQLDSAGSGQQSVGYDGQAWNQGQHPTCVASSTVTARAMVDPLYALQLTTGGHPGDPAYDNGPASQRRWMDESNRVYNGGRSWYDLGDGMSDGESKDVANQEIASHTGAQYDTVDLGDTDQRRDVLGRIEQAVDSGKPVPLGVKEKTWFFPDGHQMVVIAHRGDQLEIYNPWGYSSWVSEDDFVNNRLGSLTDNELPNVDHVQLPR